MKHLILPHISLFLANTIYALNYLFAKDVMPDYISPRAFILIRVLGGSVVFYWLHRNFIREKLASKDLLYLFVCSLFGVVFNMLCFFEGLNITGPINASLIMITTPLIVYIISCIISTRDRQYERFLGVILGLVGALLLITEGAYYFNGNILGDFLIFLNAFSYAIYLILIKSMMIKYHPITVLKYLFIIGLLILIPIGGGDFMKVEFNSMPFDIILKVCFVVFFTTCVAYFLNIYAISKLRPSTVAFYIYIQPLLATIFSLLMGRDSITTIKLISATLIFLGVYFVVKRTAR